MSKEILNKIRETVQGLFCEDDHVGYYEFDEITKSTDFEDEVVSGPGAGIDYHGSRGFMVSLSPDGQSIVLECYNCRGPYLKKTFPLDNLTDAIKFGEDLSITDC